MSAKIGPSREVVRRLTEAGLTPREIATLNHLSVQRVYQLLKAMDMRPAPRRDEAAS